MFGIEIVDICFGTVLLSGTVNKDLEEFLSLAAKPTEQEIEQAKLVVNKFSNLLYVDIAQINYEFMALWLFRCTIEAERFQIGFSLNRTYVRSPHITKFITDICFENNLNFQNFCKQTL